MTKHEVLVAAGREIVQAAPQAFIDLDVEADGVPGYGSLLSVGAVSPWGHEFYAELKPTTEQFIASNRKFCEAHNLQRDRLMEEGQDRDEALHNLARWAIDLTEEQDKERPILTAFNASFDFPWVDLSLKEAGILKNPFGVTGFCIESLAMALPGAYDWAKRSKSTMPPELLPPGELSHNALEDARYQQKMHFALAAKLAGH